MNTAKRSKQQEEDGDFFAHSTPPMDLLNIELKLDEFVLNLTPAVQTVVLLTSGGTTVPLEKKTVRFIDNFSTGARGAALCEEFLKHNCAVVFLQRSGSVSPFAGSNKQSIDLDFLLNIARNGGVSEQLLINARKALDYSERRKLLVTIPFVSVTEYLFKLRCCARKLNDRRLLVVLAAAVSDFYLPDSEMEEHKIQSTGLNLNLSLKPVPKLLGDLKTKWAPDSFCISFKLETNPDILIKKAAGAIEKYSMDLVVANELNTRYDQVILVEAPYSNPKLTVINKPVDDILEVPLVATLLEQKTK